MHFDQNIILIIIAAVVGIYRLVTRISEELKKQQEKRQPPTASRTEYSQPAQRTLPKTDEDRIREFLEALGQPADTAPPPKVQPRTQVPSRPLAPVQPPASMRPFTKPRFRAWKEQIKDVLSTPSPPKIKRVVGSSGPAQTNEPGEWMAEEHDEKIVPVTTTMATPMATEPPVRRAPVETLWKQNLRSPDSLRTAIILREIFGPPRGLQSIEI